MTSTSCAHGSTTSWSRATRHDEPTGGYHSTMTHMDHERDHAIEVEGVPAGEDISPGDAAERIDEDPEEQTNRRDPVWDDDEHED